MAKWSICSSRWAHDTGSLCCYPVTVEPKKKKKSTDQKKKRWKMKLNIFLMEIKSFLWYINMNRLTRCHCPSCTACSQPCRNESYLKVTLNAHRGPAWSSKSNGRSHHVVPLLLVGAAIAETPHCVKAPSEFSPPFTSYIPLTCLRVTLHDQLKLLLKEAISHPSPLHVLLPTPLGWPGYFCSDTS